MRLAVLSATVAALTIAGGAAAQEAPPQLPPEPAPAGPDISFNVALTSDYVFRGVSQTDEEPALQAGADLTSGLFYAGVWGSNVDFGDGTDVEVDLYAGVKPQAAGWTFDLGVIYYAYLNQPDDAEWNYVEAKAAASRSFGPLSVGGALFFSPEFTGETGQALYSELNGGYAFGPRLSVTGAVGRQDIDEAGDYTTWNLGAVVTPVQNITVDLRYWDTDLDGVGIADERFVATVKFAL